MRNLEPKDSMDYPLLSDELFVFWIWNGIPWPSAGREFSYLSTRTSSLNGSAIYLSRASEAAVFMTEEAALKWKSRHEAKRCRSYSSDMKLTTVAEFKQTVGFAVESAGKAPNTKTVKITEDQIVVNRQSLLDIVRALDIGADNGRLPAALDNLREPFFSDEITNGKARTDFSMNSYHLSAR